MTGAGPGAMIDPSSIRLEAEGLYLPEGPRWRAGELVFSDMFGLRVAALDAKGGVRTIAAIEQQPSGLGWLDDGRMIVVSMLDRTLQVVDSDGSASVLADLSACSADRCNDMAVDPRGWAYIGSFPFAPGETPRQKIDNALPAAIVLADFRDPADVRVSIAADGLMMPNGMQVTPDGRTLIVAETAGRCLTAFDIGENGGLSGRRVWAKLPVRPDGICLDAHGAMWVATPLDSPAFLRVCEGGTITDTIPVEGLGGFACELGGADGQTLYLLEAPYPVQTDVPLGRIRSVRVTVPGCAWLDANKTGA